MSVKKNERGTTEKIDIFSNFFIGRTDVFGTYDPETGRTFQKKEPVNSEIIKNHLLGKQPYGMYMLVNDKTKVIAIDFDNLNRLPPINFINQAKHYGIPAYLEISKLKGFHVWIFMKEWVSAIKARTLAHNILHDIGEDGIEVFPKQNYINPKKKFGSFINAPLFGAHVKRGKTMFIDPVSFKPVKNQWDFLEEVELVEEKELETLISINEWDLLDQKKHDYTKQQMHKHHTFQIYPCTKKMMLGVKKNQRSTAFRLAVHLKNFGFPQKTTVEFLTMWATLNKPYDGREKIKKSGIIAKVDDVYEKDYKSLGCGNNETKPHCSNECPFYSK